MLPLVPPYLTFIAGTTIEEVATRREARARRDIFFAAVLFIFGFSTVFVGLGATASAFGQVLHEYFSTSFAPRRGRDHRDGLAFFGRFPVRSFLSRGRVTCKSRPEFGAPTSWGWRSVSVGRLASDQFSRPFSRSPRRRRQSAKGCCAARRLFGRAWPAVFAGGAGD